jgi:hypothetical protein
MLHKALWFLYQLENNKIFYKIKHIVISYKIYHWIWLDNHVEQVNLKLLVYLIWACLNLLLFMANQLSPIECVICMSDMRDTLILPCRHLCLCSTCAESLRYQASNCPICRSPFRALLQIRAMRRKQAVSVQVHTITVTTATSDTYCNEKFHIKIIKLYEG